MGLRSKIADGRRRKLTEFMGPQLEPGETLHAMVPMLQTGNPAWQGIGLTGFFGFVLTERNLYVASWRQSIPERPREVVGKLPRAGLVVEQWDGRGTIVVRAANGETVQLQVPGMHRQEAEALVASLPRA
jgi:hypothetical protein